MIHRLLYFLLLAVLLSPADGYCKDKVLQHTRLTRDSSGRLQSLDVAVTTLSKHNKQVDLIGALHVGEKSYYLKLNELFATYDKVLFELVSPEGVDLSDTSDNVGIHQPMAYGLGLVDQLGYINYAAKNFVHADLSAEGLRQAMDEGGQTFFDIFKSVFLTGLKEQATHAKKSKILSMKLILGLISPNRKLLLKRALAEQFSDLETQMDQLGGELSVLLIEKRNIKALEVLKKVLQDKRNNRIAIFYGAAHMGDFVARLNEDFGFKYSKQTWLVAWNLKTASQD